MTHPENEDQMSELSDEDFDYMLNVYHRVLKAVVLTDGDGTEQGGFVRPRLAIQGLCMAIAEFAIQDGETSPAALKRRAEDCRRSILETMKTMVASGGDATRLISRPVHIDE
jgi:hypothetical protein